ncbi:ABC transporter ATP-binding protein [uncultured Chitinophaga sp.]|jgi:ABC-type multidrug transport system, ATPase and permease components|uniref:ABC transporter ATP-binding protein n=1 Tax=uncultured Chitinophaga sp. TaxID=339340 RepID=UPI0026308A3E|nr:ABC transporter ATP-binding protein [uncultured Chitinophaga sp.]
MKLKVIKRFLIYLKPYKWHEVLLCVLMLMSSAGSLSSPYLLKVIIDDVFPGKDHKLLLQILLLLVAIYILRLVAAFFSDYVYIRLSNRIVLDIRKDLFNRIMRYPLSYFHNNKPSDLHHKISNEVGRIQQILTNSIIRLLNNMLTIAGLVIMLCVLNVQLFLISAMVFPFIYLNIKYFTPRLRKIYGRVSNGEADLNGFFLERFNAVKLIKSFNAYTFENTNLHDRQETLMGLHLKSIINTSMNRNIATFLIALGPIMVFGWGGSDVLAGTMSLGGLVAFLQYLNRLYSPSTDLMYLHTDLQRAYVSMEQLYELFEQPAERSAGAECAGGEVQDIRLRNVTFGYNGVDVLSNCDLDLQAGKCYAIAGATGCGKSTLLQLLCRFYKPLNGSIAVNGVDLEDIDLHAWRDRVMFVSQEGCVFHDTIYRNVIYNSDAAPNDVRAAFRMAEMQDFLKQLPAGEDTVVGSKGATVSGGQSQKINIARCLLRRSSLLLLDEATAAIDSESEQLILDNIRGSGQHNIILLVSHRLSTIKKADEIIFLDKGRIVEQGTHEQLVMLKGAYYKLFRHQLITEEKTGNEQLAMAE